VNITASSANVKSNAVMFMVTLQPTSFTRSDPMPSSLRLGAGDLKTSTLTIF
jgi:hypothetical protein